MNTPDLGNRLAYSLRELPLVLPFGRTFLEGLIVAGKFPSPIKLGKGKKRIYRKADIEKWLEEQKATA